MLSVGASAQKKHVSLAWCFKFPTFALQVGLALVDFFSDCGFFYDRVTRFGLDDQLTMFALVFILVPILSNIILLMVILVREFRFDQVRFHCMYFVVFVVIDLGEYGFINPTIYIMKSSTLDQVCSVINSKSMLKNIQLASCLTGKHPAICVTIIQCLYRGIRGGPMNSNFDSNDEDQNSWIKATKFTSPHAPLALAKLLKLLGCGM